MRQQLRQYQAIWLQVIANFSQGKQLVLEETPQADVRRIVKAVQKEKYRDSDNWQHQQYCRLAHEYNPETYELKLWLVTRLNKNHLTESLKVIL